MDLQVVVVSNEAWINGGAASVAISSAVALARAGVGVTFFAGTGPVDPLLTAQKRLRVVCVDRPEYIKVGLRGLIRGLWDPSAAARLRAVLAETHDKPTVVHFHSFVERLSGSVTRVPQECGIPAVFTLHEYGLACPYGGFYNFRTGAPCGRRGLSFGCWATACSTAPYPRKLWRASRLALQRARGGAPRVNAAYLCVSEFSRDLMRPYLPSGARIEYVPNPIVVEDRGAARVAESDVFLYLGRLSPEKGAEVFAAASELAGVRAVFAGEGEERARRENALPRCKFEGWLPAKRAQSALRGARALVFPSRLYETLGMAVLEASSMGVPSIVSDETAAARSIEAGVNGLVFRSGSPQSLAEALCAMTPDAAARMGKEAYSRFWKDPPTIECHTARLLEVYREVVAACPRG